MNVPVICAAVKPKGKQEELKTANALSQLSKQDSALGIRIDSDSGTLFVLGSGEGQLRRIFDRLTHEFRIDAEFGPFRVFYREGIKATVLEEARFIREHAGLRQFAHCVLELRALPKREGFEFVNAAKENAVSAYAASIEKGVRRALEAGPLEGCPIVGVKATLVGGSVEGGSDEWSFEIAGMMTLRSGCRKAQPFLLEPIMTCEVAAPEKDSESLIEDLKGRRAESIEIIGGSSRRMRCLIPMSELLGYDGPSIKMELSQFRELASGTGPAKHG